MGYGNLQTIYRSNFELSYYHGYSLEELKRLVPWERYLIIDMIVEDLKEKKRDREEARIKARN